MSVKCTLNDTVPVIFAQDTMFCVCVCVTQDTSARRLAAAAEGVEVSLLVLSMRSQSQFQCMLCVLATTQKGAKDDVDDMT